MCVYLVRSVPLWCTVDHTTLCGIVLPQFLVLRSHVNFSFSLSPSLFFFPPTSFSFSHPVSSPRPSYPLFSLSLSFLHSPFPSLLFYLPLSPLLFPRSPVPLSGCVLLAPFPILSSNRAAGAGGGEITCAALCFRLDTVINHWPSRTSTYNNKDWLLCGGCCTIAFHCPDAKLEVSGHSQTQLPRPQTVSSFKIGRAHV